MWQLRPVDEAEAEALSRELGVSATTARLLWLRGFRDAAAARPFWEGRGDLAFLAEPVATPGMLKAVARLREACERQEPICIYGDYDADGVTASALLYRYLKYGPRANVEAYLPDRFIDGYGINAQAVRRLAAEGKRLIVTCDNGIAAVEAAAVAKELGVDLIVTDHHQVPERLPDAYAIVHPQVEFPHLADLSGVGVALLVVIAMEGGWHERLRPMLDLVALGSVADVVSLAGPNRALVWAGIQHIRTTARLRPGLKALIAVTGHAKPETLSARTIAFSLAPMINAAGRIEKPQLAFDLLVTNDAAEARTLADELHAINQARRELDRELVERLCADIEAELAHTTEPFLVLADEAFHHGITGIVAGRLKERYRKPVLLLSHHEDDLWKGSGRSLEGCHLYEALASCQDLLLGFGGHAQAAGCSIRAEHIPELRRRLNAFLEGRQWQPPEDITWLDATPPLRELTPALLEELERFEPTGQGNPPPALGLIGARVLQVRTDRSGKHLFVRVDDGEVIREAVSWGSGESAGTIGGWLNMTYRPKFKLFRGEESLELAIDRMAAGEPPAKAPVASAPEAPARLIDHRHQTDRLRVVRERLAAGQALAIYTGDRLPDLELDRAVGRRHVEYWSDRQASYGAVAELVLLERPYSLDAWTRLVAGVTGTVHLAWESPQVEPELSEGWLLAFHRELTQLGHLSWQQLVNRPWETTTLMVRSALDMLREAGLVTVDGPAWVLAPAPAGPIGLEALATFRAYREAHAFRLLLANGARDELFAALPLPGSATLAAAGRRA